MTVPQTFAYRSADGTELTGYHWAASAGTPTIAAVVIAHGMGEHLRRYDHVAEALNARGFAVYGHDHRGHGSSIPSDGTPGHLGSGGWHALVEDLNLAVAKAKADHPDKPVAIIGHSMGSFATQQFLMDHARDIDAVVLSGTAALDLLESSIDLSAAVDLSAFNAAFEPARTESDWLSRDPDAVDAYVADPLCGFGIDAESNSGMFAGARDAAEPARLAGLPKDLPVYLAVGSKDPVNADLTLVHALADRYRTAGLTDVTVRIYDDARHEVFNETNRSEVIEDLVTWLERATSTA